ncbi:MAG: hypothetical protein ACRD4K_08200, partial [Candidatus Acidiferrales bacterium]
MRDRSVLAFPLLLAGVASCFFSLGRSPLDKPLAAIAAPDSARREREVDASRISAKYARMPLRFEANEGQTDRQVKFMARGNSYTLFLTSDAAVLTLQKPAQQAPGAHETELDVVRMKLSGANAGARVEGSERLEGTSNYFLGKNPRGWRTRVANYARVRYRDIYRGVDLVYYGRGGELEYDFVVAPGADPRKIEFELKGLRGIRSDARGNLVMRTQGGEVVLR